MPYKVPVGQKIASVSGRSYLGCVPVGGPQENHVATGSDSLGLFRYCSEFYLLSSELVLLAGFWPRGNLSTQIPNPCLKITAENLQDN